MDAKDVFAAAHFAPDKMQKINLFETEHFFCDVYCLEPGQDQKPHAHDDQDKIYLVLEGRGRVVVGAASETLEAGEAIVAPAGTSHGIANDGTARLTVLVVVAPPPAHA